MNQESCGTDSGAHDHHSGPWPHPTGDPGGFRTNFSQPSRRTAPVVLPSGTPTIRAGQAVSANGTAPQEVAGLQEAFLCGLPIWQNDQETWRVKGESKQTTRVATRPGQVVAVDQLESNSPGVIAQLKGKLTQQRYKYATVFVDQYSGYTFIYLQRHLTSEEMVHAKHAFERSAEQRGVKILHYHADNGRFADNAFINRMQDTRPRPFLLRG